MRTLKIAFLVHRIGLYEIYGIAHLSAMAKRLGHAVILVEFSRSPRKAFLELESFAPDIVGYTVASMEADLYVKLNAALKEKMRFFAVFGGPHPTFFPHFIHERGVDAICRGEGDLAFASLLERFGTPAMMDVPNFSFKLPGGQVKENPLADLVCDLDSLPHADLDLIYARDYYLRTSPVKTFFAGRGCPYHCTYCFNHIYNAMYADKGSIVRVKSVGYVLEELQQVRARYPLSFVRFQDDIFGMRREWLDEFATRYPKEIGIPFQSFARPNMVTGEYAKTLKRAGCFSITMAIESGSDRIRNGVLKRHMTDEHILAACRHFRDAGIAIYTLNMIGLPDEEDEDIWKTININRHGGVDFADSSIFQPYPGTEITDYCIAKGYIDRENRRYVSQYDSSILNYSPKKKKRIFILHRMFPMLVDYPVLDTLLPLLFKLPIVKIIHNIVYKLYYAWCIDHRIFNCRFPLHLKLIAAWKLMFYTKST